MATRFKSVIALLAAVAVVTTAACASVGVDYIVPPTSWGPEDVEDPGSRFETGRLSLVQFECCEKQDMGSWGEGWVATGIVENSTERNLSGVQFFFEIYDKDGIIMDNPNTRDILLVPGETKYLKMALGIDGVAMSDSEYRAIESIKLVGARWVSYKSDVQEKVAATMRAPTPTAAPPTPTRESASTVKRDTHLNSGVNYAQDGHYENAINEYTKAIQLDPSYADAYANRSLAYSYLRNPQALEDSNKAIQLDSGSAKAYVGRGLTYTMMGEWQRAIQDYDKAIQLDPDSVLAYEKRSIYYFINSQWQQAIQDLDKYIQLVPDDAMAYISRGNAYIHLLDYERAIEDYDKAIQLDPENAGAYFDRSEAYRELGQHVKADADKAKACSLATRNESKWWGCKR